MAQMQCGWCKGSGRIGDEVCIACSGKGWVTIGDKTFQRANEDYGPPRGCGCLGCLTIALGTIALAMALLTAAGPTLAPDTTASVVRGSE